MGRQKGSKNKEQQPALLAMPEDAQVKLLADIILELIDKEDARQQRREDVAAPSQ